MSGYGPLAAALALLAAALLVLPVAARSAVAATASGETARLRGLRLPRRAAAPDPFEAAAAYDLFAVCLRAGMPTADAARATAAGAPPALAEVLTRAAELLALGSDPETAWRTESVDPQVVGLSRMLRRSARAGSSPAAGLADLARTERAQAEDRAVAAGERAGVAVAGPLGLCFLPAFVCLGIVPVVMGLAGKVLGEGLL
ncbi:type II secretion system F family protein [Tsukamurella ocularis]|uniref:type II secretion system F family protein n=1 Tax=Tsukamurella ocularis TaxID=1970234 RepID=UPI002169A40D|nr:type II secretion system F family protein [Tsukamurella ocularis]MCS3778973.1 pilus assembly protein TadC [Tsukamurella ocularis]MCS3787407.1 pilus assembly protein TadC [Tsukamurella ocularis]MCS3851656.1 pilus assembly protein TadC [Tsukamurella ocularis]